MACKLNSYTPLPPVTGTYNKLQTLRKRSYAAVSPYKEIDYITSTTSQCNFLYISEFTVLLFRCPSKVTRVFITYCQ